MGGVLSAQQGLLEFILEQLETTARECSDLRAAERLRMLAGEIKCRDGLAPPHTAMEPAVTRKI
jgi:hypothetical protein